MKLIEFRRACHYSFHRPVGFWGKLMNALLALLIITSISAIPLYFIDRFAEGIRIFDGIVVALFSLEWLLRIWSAAWPMRTLFSWFSLVEIASILPFYLALFGIIDFHIAALFLFLRIFKLGKIYELERTSVSKISKTRHGNFQTFPHEKIERVVHRHPITFFFGLFPILIFTEMGIGLIIFFPENIWSIGLGIFCSLLALLFFFKSWLDFHYDVIYITNDRIIVQNRQIFGSVLNDISYEAITNIKPDTTSIWHFLLGLGNIQIETAAAQKNQLFSDAADAQKVVEHISQNRQKALARNDRISPILPSSS